MAFNFCNKSKQNMNFVRLVLLIILISIAFVVAEDNERKITKTANETTTTVKIGGDKVVEHHESQNPAPKNEK